MTLPTLIQKQQEKVTVTKVKKAYSILSQAYLMATQDKGYPDEWGMGGMYEESSHKILAENMIPYMKVTRNCINMNENDVIKSCTAKYSDVVSYKSVRLNDGVTVVFRNYRGDCKFNYGINEKLASNTCGVILIDTNGNSKPNMMGKDIFAFGFSKYGVYPNGMNGITPSFSTHCTLSKPWDASYGGYTNGGSCTAWVIHNENMDYLHCDDLSWDGKHSCKD